MTFVRTHIGCTHCGSSDGASLNEDGSIYCFVCTHRTASTTYIESHMTTDTTIDDNLASVYSTSNSVSVSDRRLTKATTERYGVVRTKHHIDKKKLVDGGDSYLFPYYSKDNKLVAAKVRGVAEKTFGTVGSWTEGTLFGQHLFPSGGKYLTITEGEFDALAVYQLTG